MCDAGAVALVDAGAVALVDAHIRQCNNYLTNLKVGINDVAMVTV